MKAKRRHELHENVLGAELTQVIDFFRRRGALIAWGLLIAALIVLVVFYARDKSRKKAFERRSQLDKALMDANLTPTERIGILKDLSAKNDLIAARATLALGDMFARRMAVTGPDADPAAWRTLGDQAAAYYRDAIARFGEMKVQVAKAHLGLAVLAENRRDFEAARSEYEIVANDEGLAGQPVAELAREGLAGLKLLAEGEVRMATTAPAEPATQPATQPVTQPGDKAPVQ